MLNLAQTTTVAQASPSRLIGINSALFVISYWFITILPLHRITVHVHVHASMPLGQPSLYSASHLRLLILSTYSYYFGELLDPSKHYRPIRFMPAIEVAPSCMTLWFLLVANSFIVVGGFRRWGRSRKEREEGSGERHTIRAPKWWGCW